MIKCSKCSINVLIYKSIKALIISNVPNVPNVPGKNTCLGKTNDYSSSPNVLISKSTSYLLTIAS